MKGTIKLLSVLMIAIMLVSVVSVPVHATTLSNQVKALETEVSTTTGGDTTDIQKIAAKIIKWIRNVAVIAGVLILTVLGL